MDDPMTATTGTKPDTSKPAKGATTTPAKTLPGTTPGGKAPRTPKPYVPCKCLQGTGNQCPGKTQGAFARGHDARMSSRIATLIAEGKLTEQEGLDQIRAAGGGDLLIGKTQRSAKLRAEQAAAKAEARAKKAAEKDAAKAAPKDAPAVQVNQKVKVKHGGKNYDAVVIRNAANDLKARHRFQGKDCDHDLDV